MPGIKAGEDVVVIGDAATRSIGQALRDAASEVGGHTVLDAGRSVLGS